MPGGEDNTFDGQNHAVKVADSTLISSSYIYKSSSTVGRKFQCGFCIPVFFAAISGVSFPSSHAFVPSSPSM